MKKFIALSISVVVFIMLINIKMPTVGILTFISMINFYIYEQDNFRAQLSWAWKKVFDALSSRAGKGLTFWLSFVMSNCDVVTFPLVSWVRWGARLYRFLIFSFFLIFL